MFFNIAQEGGGGGRCTVPLRNMLTAHTHFIRAYAYNHARIRVLYAYACMFIRVYVYEYMRQISAFVSFYSLP